MKRLVPVILLVLVFCADSEITNADESVVPEPFRGFDSSSTKTINYDVLNEHSTG